MNCKQAKTEILGADLHQGSLSAEVEGHLSKCPGCSRALAEVRALARSVGALDRPCLPPGFEQRFRARMELVRERKQRRKFWKWFLPVPAAALAAALVVLILKIAEGPGPPSPTFVRYARIELIVEAEEPVPAVSLSLFLPAGLAPFLEAGIGEKEGEEGPCAFHWSEDLAEGTNRYHLPVAAATYGSYEVRAVLSSGPDRAEALLTLQVSEAGIRTSSVSASATALARFSFRLVTSPEGTFSEARS